MGNLEERFQSKFTPEPNTGCWLWHGARVSAGYGVISSKNDRLAHRVSYRLYVGDIATGLEIDHLCRTKCCVNPDHLEAVTHSENITRAHRRSKKTTCINGHAFTDENTYRRQGIYRRCKKCQATQDARYRQRRRS